MKRIVLDIAKGKISGNHYDDDVIEFLGIPYADYSEGYRFKKAKESTTWTGIRDHSEYGPTAPQLAYSYPNSVIFPSKIIEGKNYLNLNIWSKYSNDNLPVMVFIHGGSFTSGSGSINGYNGHSFAEKDVVLVTINYRLGIEGFLLVEDGDLNIGIYDQILALQWIKENIHFFGGNRNNVTVFGESAGAMSIGTLLSMPEAEGLFAKAILESGAASNAMNMKEAKKIAEKLKKILKIKKLDRETLLDIPMKKLLNAQENIRSGTSLPFEPIIDGKSIKKMPIHSLEKNCKVPIMIGLNHEEALLIFSPTGKVENIRGYYNVLIALLYKLPIIKTLSMYNSLNIFKKTKDETIALATDIVYRVPAYRLAKKVEKAVVYEFMWQSPAFNHTYGAGHGVEIPFVFNNLDNSDWKGVIGDKKDYELANKVQEKWIDFSKKGINKEEEFINVSDIQKYGNGYLDKKDIEKRWEFLDKNLKN